MKNRDFILITILSLLAFLYLFPIYWTVITSLKPNSQVFTNPPMFYPSSPTLTNYYQSGSAAGAVAQSATGALPYIVTSFVVAAVTSFLSTFLIGAPSAYALVRHVRGKLWIARLILFTIMIPEIVLVVPFFNIITHAGLLNTWWALMLTYISFTAPFSTWILIGFFSRVPKVIEEAAEMDGMPAFQIFQKISLRLVTAGLIATLVLNFVNCWNEFLYALVLTLTPYNFGFPPYGAQTSQVYISSFIVVERSVAWGGLAATGVVTMLPVLILGLFFERYIRAGATLGSVKG
jgi:ABC-type glycerol-3-phosphate transport system permease component